MKLRDFPGWLRDTTLRLFPHRTRPGLRAIGEPDAAAPILVTGNFTLTVRRMMKTLEGRDVWLLVADSQGINVWCAAGGGHLTHHEVVAAVRACAISSRVSHRMLILPQLAATGVEPHKITATTGFETRWGPARLEDLPAYLDRGYRTVKRDRYMRFPLWERMEMAVMWAAPMTPILMLVVWLLIDLRTALVCGTIALIMVFGLFAAVGVSLVRQSDDHLVVEVRIGSCIGDNHAARQHKQESDGNEHPWQSMHAPLPPDRIWN